ncbi:MAG TPA: PIN domain-containing protein [Stellaceae bacterium]|nr:PIN domain-containing protein [Stellaceae bacterium]
MIAIVADSQRFTLDSNVLVYAVDGRAGLKHETARQIVLAAARLDCWLTFQSVSEFYVAVTRKRIVPAAAAAERVVDWMTAFRCLAVSGRTIQAALPNAVARRSSYWNALLVATAAEAGCNLVLTEDMADGTFLSGVQIHNPFVIGGMSDMTRQLLDLRSAR